MKLNYQKMAFAIFFNCVFFVNAQHKDISKWLEAQRKDDTWAVICQENVYDILPKLNLDDTSMYLDFDTKPDSFARVSASVKSVENNTIKIGYSVLTGVTGRNRDLSWLNFSHDSIIAEIKYYNDEKLSFEWFGFYNEKTKKREFLRNPFDAKENPVFLKKCP